MEAHPRLWSFVITTVVGALFPRLLYRANWVARLRPRGLMIYIALTTAFGFSMRQWVRPFFTEWAEETTKQRAELAQKLGREPTDEELQQHMMEQLGEYYPEAAG